MGLITGVHLAAKFAFSRAGYKWELRRAGELKIGMWRVRFSEKKANPKRFVFVPGFGDTPLSWLTVLLLLRPTLARKYDEVIVLDFPGFGGFLSEHAAFPSMDLLLSSVADVFDSLKPHTIMGHSLGGWLTAHYAASCGDGSRPLKTPRYAGPETVFLIDPSGVFGSEDRKAEWTKVFEDAIEQGFMFFRPKIFAKEPFWFRAIAKECGNFLSKQEVISFIRSVRDEHLVEKRLGQITAKVWLMWGEDDGLIPSIWSHAWLEGLKNAELVLIRGAGHSPQLEKPAVTAAAVMQMLGGRAPHMLGSRWWRVVAGVE